MIFFKNFSIELSQPHNLEHKFDGLTRIGSPLNSQITYL
jgi:hypothetical protein